MVAHCFASSSGSRSGSTTTFMPNFSRSVPPASAAISASGSSAGCGETRRSLCHSESMPPPSHSSTQRQKARGPENG